MGYGRRKHIKETKTLADHDKGKYEIQTGSPSRWKKNRQTDLFGSDRTQRVINAN